MLFLIHVTFTSENVNQLAARFVSATENGDELPNGVSLVSRYHSPSTKQTFMVADVDKVEAMNEWLLKYSDLGDFSVHPIVTDENIGPAVEQILAWGA